MALKFALPTAGWSQADQRNQAVFYDQHKHKKSPDGRPWWCFVEKPAEGAAMPMPVGPLIPMGWEEMGIVAPWEPDQKYIVRSIGRARQGKTFGNIFEFRFEIDYRSMITDFRREMDAYYGRAVKEAAALNLKLPGYGEVLQYQLRQIVGEAPMSPKIPEAAMAGDEWLLGYDPDENELLARLITMRNAGVETVEQSVKTGDDMATMRAEMEKLKQMMADMGMLGPVAKKRTRGPNKPKAVPSDVVT